MLAFKPPWFVYVDPDDDLPAFRRGRDVLTRPGICVGPFPSARAADRFIGILEDVFQLCRDPRCLAQAPEAETCTYGQMGRCLRPCDGTIGLDAYRRVVARAGQFAAGKRDPVRQELGEKMQQASAALEFEQAAQLKTRLERIAELADPAFAHVRPREQLAYLSVQRSGKAHTVNVLLLWAGRIASAGRVPYPPGLDRIESLLDQMRQMVRQAGRWALPERLRMGLAAQMLLASPRRGGLWVDWTEQLTAEQVRSAILDAADELKVTPPPERKSKPSAEEPEAADTTGKDRQAGAD
jgi:excinuclease UvrABC nuclease subunit